MPKESFRNDVIVGLVFTAMGYLVAFVIGKPILDNAKESLDWPTTQGVVQEAKVERASGGRGGIRYSPFIEYVYSVGKKQYTADKVYFGDEEPSKDKEGVEEIVRRYPKGSRVTVSYNPDLPDEAVLEPGARWRSYFFFLFGLPFLAAGLIVLLGVIKKVFFLFFGSV